MQRIHHTSEFQEMLRSPRAMTFLHACWSAYSVDSLKLFHDFHHQSSESAWAIGVGLSFWEIDISDQSGEIWDETWTWIESRKVDPSMLMISGSGAIIWSEQGVIKKTVSSAIWLNSFLNTTRAAFS